MSARAILYLEPLSESIAHRPYLGSIGGRPILDLLAESASEFSGPDGMLVLYHHESERMAIEQSISTSSLQLQCTPHFSKLAAVSDAAARVDSADIVLFHLGSCLAPRDFPSRVLLHHWQHENAYTGVKGLPRECSVSVFQTDVLQNVFRLTSKLGIFDPESAASKLSSAVKVAGQPTPVLLNSIPFDFAAAYGLRPFQLPRSLTLRLASDFVLANDVVRAAQEVCVDPLQATVLTTWKQLSIIRHAAESRAAPRERSLRVPSGRRPRVLYISLPSGFSGAEESLCSLVEKIDKKRFELFALTSVSGVFTRKLAQLGVKVVCPESNLGEPTLENLHFADALLHRVRPDIVHLNGQEALPFVFRLAMSDIAVVQHVRNGDLAGFEQGVILADSVIAVSEFIKNEVLGFPVDGEKIKVIYDEVDSGEFRPDIYTKAQARRELHIPQESLVALMVARVAPNKRHDIVLRAAPSIKGEIPSFQLVIKGDLFTEAPVHYQLKRLIEELGLSPYLTWLNFVPDMRTLIAAADVMVLCSDREGLGRCIVEAMSMEIPVVVSDTGGTHELIINGERGGFVVPGDSPQALATRVVELLKSPTLRAELGKRGREYVIGHLDSRISAQAVMTLYDQLLSNSNLASTCNRCAVTG